MSKERIQFKIYGLRVNMSVEDWKEIKKRFDIRRTGITYIPEEAHACYSILHECSLCAKHYHFLFHRAPVKAEELCGRCPLAKFRKLVKVRGEQRQLTGCMVLMLKILEIPVTQSLSFNPFPEAIHYSMRDKIKAEAQLKKIYDKMEEIEARRDLQ